MNNPQNPELKSILLEAQQESIDNKIESENDSCIYPFLEATSPLINAFNATGITLTLYALMSTDTDEGERDEINQYILLATLSQMIYGFSVQFARQWFPDRIGTLMENFDKYFWAATNACCAHFFALYISENMYIERMTAGEGTNNEVVVTPLTFGLLNIFPATLALGQLYCELNVDHKLFAKKIKHFLLDSIEKVSIIEGLAESIEDMSGISRNSSLSEIVPRYSTSLVLGLLINYRACKSRQQNNSDEIPIYTSFPLYAEEFISGFSLAIFLFQQSLKKMSPFEQHLLSILVTSMGLTTFISRFYLGKAHRPQPDDHKDSKVENDKMGISIEVIDEKIDESKSPSLHM